MLLSLLLSTHAFATLAMVGLIWFVQIVHYPLFAGVASDCFRAYEAAHQRRTTVVVAPLMLAELVSAVGLVLLLGSALTWTGLGLLAVCWVSTAFVQVPLHRRLERGWDEQAGRKLVTTNWVRTIAWTGRGVIALLLFHSAGSAS